MTRTAPRSFEQPHPSQFESLHWSEAVVPGTAAGSMREAGHWSTEDVLDFDAFDWWFRTSFDGSPGTLAALHINGLATIADVWLNDEHVVHSENMFERHRIIARLAETNHLVVVCRSVKQHLAERRPRPRWKTRIVEHQQLRWIRATLLGRMPSWTPPAAPVGIWRSVEVVPLDSPALASSRLRASLVDHAGVVDFEATIDGLTITHRASARLVLDGPTRHTFSLDLDRSSGFVRVSGASVLPDPALWWPHTHGSPSLYRAALHLEHDGGTNEFDLGAIGFRAVAVDRVDPKFAVAINDISVFCRGACWVPLDVVTLQSSRSDLADALQQVRDAGMNMVRLTGPMVYETSDFYDICDEMGILVWQDLMFANMDYPAHDEAFLASVDAEVTGVLQRLQRHPSVVVICGGSEIEQQASMMGIDSDAPINELGRHHFPRLVAESGISAEYVVCSPSGGVFPFVPNAAVSHYYGVGAYLRPLDDARRASVQFTSECLAFSNIPCRETVDAFLGDGERPNHSPRWKARVPRDRGSGWDFEDVRDHYVRSILGVDPLEVRYSDADRYLDLGRAAVCVAIESSISEWRRPDSSCNGALVFQLRDLWRGAGWGLIDSDGRPKSAYYAMKRASAPVAISITDEGLNGMYANVMNDRPSTLEATARASVFGHEGLIASVERPVALRGHGSMSISVDGMFAEFRDLNFSYRFGPQRYEVVTVALTDASGATLSDAFFLPRGHDTVRRVDPGLTAVFAETDTGPVVRLRTDGFAHFVSIEIPGATCDDNWFHLAPGEGRDVGYRRRTAVRGAAEVIALNGFGPVGIAVGT